MKTKFAKAMKKLFHDFAIVELRLQNRDYSNLKLTYNSILYLDIIEAHPGEYTASDIADLLQVARPSVTQKINKLEKMGYITKKQSSLDKRFYYIYFNEESRSPEIIEEFDRADSAVVEKLSKEYTQEEIEKFYEMLSLVGDSYLEELS
ncbi:MAG: MarR family transcriptional regulator [Caldisericia bacterium]|nr:MarR family transcriptional regulator [Caldisericia bacterium]